jgi:hypothetical protein
MLTRRALWSDDSEEDGDLGVIDRLEFHPVRHDEQGRDLLLELRKRSVRDGHPLADPG